MACLVQILFKYDKYQTTNLTPDKVLNILIYRSAFYDIIYKSYKLRNVVQFLVHPVITYTRHNVPAVLALSGAVALTPVLEPVADLSGRQAGEFGEVFLLARRRVRVV